MSMNDTIYALSTGPAISAIAVVRLSGKGALSALGSLTARSAPEPRRFSLRELRAPATGEMLDQAGVIWMPGPDSFTGEDCVEFHLHGSQAVVSGVLSSLAQLDGLRMAEPGEFTRRAFVNGRMDLVEVEGLADLLSAKTAIQRRQALLQMSGSASSCYESWRSRLIAIRALIEASIDFADEQGVSEEASSEIDHLIDGLVRDVSAALAGREGAELVRSGVRVALVGRPNTGKSSLLNALARRDVALVSPVAGTTRDVISVNLDLGGVMVTVSDMAGLRQAVSDDVESAGVRRAMQEAQAAQIRVWVCSEDVEGSAESYGEIIPDVFVIGKSDMSGTFSIQDRNNPLNRPAVRVSAQTGDGVSDLVAVLGGMARDLIGNVEHAVVVSARQYEVLQVVLASLELARNECGDAMELKADWVSRAADSMGRVTGRTDAEEWLGAIFSRFCIGK